MRGGGSATLVVLKPVFQIRKLNNADPGPRGALFGPGSTSRELKLNKTNFFIKVLK